MSTPASSGTADALQATQQQLDELETLIQRMLAVPVHQLDDEPELPDIPPAIKQTESQRDYETPVNQYAPSWDDATSSTLADFAVGEEPVRPEPTPVHSESESATMACIELPETGADSPLAARFEFLDSKSADVPDWNNSVPRVAPEPIARPVAVAAPRPIEESFLEPLPRLAWWLWLLVKVNRAFDGLTRCLGTPGRRLRRPQGRAVLGWIGVLSLGAALAWALLDWIVRRW